MHPDYRKGLREAEGGMSDKLKRSRFRFSLMALLVVMTLLAVALGAYFAGYRNGYSDGASVASRQQVANYLQFIRPYMEREKNKQNPTR